MVGMVDIVHSQALTTEHATSGLGMKLAISFVLRWSSLTLICTYTLALVED